MDYFGYKGKTVVVTGAASGMGEAAVKMLVDLGAKVHAVGHTQKVAVPVEKAYYADLGSKEEIGRLLGELPEKIDALFICQGIAQGKTKENHEMVMFTNYLGCRFIAEGLASRIADEGSISFITSTGGFGWLNDFADCKEVLDLGSWEEAATWFASHEQKLRDAYRFSKRLLNTYVQYRVHDPLYIGRKIRINAICPGNTDTKLAEDSARNTSPTGDIEEGRRKMESLFQDSWDGRWAASEEMGYPLVAIGSKLFSYTSGQVITIDYGVTSVWTIEDQQGVTDHFMPFTRSKAD